MCTVFITNAILWIAGTTPAGLVSLYTFHAYRRNKDKPDKRSESKKLN